MIDGSWRYLEHDWVAGPGDYFYEPIGDVHTLVVDPAGEMITLFQALLSRSGRASAVVILPNGVGIPVVVQLPVKKGKKVSWVQQPTVYYTAG